MQKKFAHDFRYNPCTLCNFICVPDRLLSVLHVSMTQRNLLELARRLGLLLHNEHLIFCELFQGK